LPLISGNFRRFRTKVDTSTEVWFVLGAVEDRTGALPDGPVAGGGRLPAERGEFLDRETHFGDVTLPAAVAAGVLVVGVDVHLVGDDVRDAGDRGGRPRPEVVGVDRPVGVLDDVTHRVDALL